MQRYFAILHGRRLGPFTLEELGRLCTEGMLDTSAAIEEEGTGAAKALCDLLPAPQFAPPAPSPAFHAAPVEAAPAKSMERNRLPGAAWTLAIAALSLYLLIRRPDWFLLDYANLIIHEAGHLVFMFFGTFIQFLGGTLLQLAVPIIVTLVFIREGRHKSAQFSLFWLGESLLYSSVYAADARRQQLPLVGGGEHDWAYLLGRTGLLEHDAAVAAFFVILAACAFALACLWPVLGRMRDKAAAEEAVYESGH